MMHLCRDCWRPQSEQDGLFFALTQLTTANCCHPVDVSEEQLCFCPPGVTVLKSPRVCPDLWPEEASILHAGWGLSGCWLDHEVWPSAAEHQSHVPVTRRGPVPRLQELHKTSYFIKAESDEDVCDRSRRVCSVFVLCVSDLLPSGEDEALSVSPSCFQQSSGLSRCFITAHRLFVYSSL